jgi:3-hydroxy-9,10-secoandrosta-1,3,5(10)-triene-9,17-dione monooxygenase
MSDEKLAIELVERARAMKPRLRERSASVEAARVVGQDTINEFHEAGFFKILQPKAYGGYELPITVLTNVIFEIASACGSAGWVYSVLGLHQWEVAQLSAQAIADIWGDDPKALLSSSYAPTGKVELAEGGYLLNGKWRFSSGCDHANWAIIGGVRPPRSAGEEPVLCAFFVSRSDFEIIDDWHTLGLAGTGSKTLSLNNVFVPEHHQHAIFNVVAVPKDVSPLYKLPYGAVLGEALANAAFGMAQGVLDRFVEINKTRRSAIAQSNYADSPDIHHYIADCAYVIRTARTLSDDNLRRASEAANEGREVPAIDRARHMWEMSKSWNACAEAAAKLFLVSGAQAIFKDDPLQRAFRDVQSAGTHRGAAFFDDNGRNFGAMQLGQPNRLLLV